MPMGRDRETCGWVEIFVVIFIIVALCGLLFIPFVTQQREVARAQQWTVQPVAFNENIFTFEYQGEGQTIDNLYHWWPYSLRAFQETNPDLEITDARVYSRVTLNKVSGYDRCENIIIFTRKKQ